MRKFVARSIVYLIVHCISCCQHLTSLALSIMHAVVYRTSNIVNVRLTAQLHFNTMSKIPKGHFQQQLGAPNILVVSVARHSTRNTSSTDEMRVAVPCAIDNTRGLRSQHLHSPRHDFTNFINALRRVRYSTLVLPFVTSVLGIVQNHSIL